MTNLIKQGYANKYSIEESGAILDTERQMYLIDIDDINYYTVYELEEATGKKKKVKLNELYKEVFGRKYCLDKIIDLDGEQWKVIPYTDQCYYCSNKGRIKSYKGTSAKILKPTICKGGYYRIDIIYNGGARKTMLIHKLVAELFLTDKKQPLQQIHHIDNNKANNCADNLIYLSPADHREAHKRIKEQQQEKKKQDYIKLSANCTNKEIYG